MHSASRSPCHEAVTCPISPVLNVKIVSLIRHQISRRDREQDVRRLAAYLCACATAHATIETLCLGIFAGTRCRLGAEQADMPTQSKLFTHLGSPHSSGLVRCWLHAVGGCRFNGLVQDGSAVANEVAQRARVEKTQAPWCTKQWTGNSCCD